AFLPRIVLAWSSLLGPLRSQNRRGRCFEKGAPQGPSCPRPQSQRQQDASSNFRDVRGAREMGASFVFWQCGWQFQHDSAAAAARPRHHSSSGVAMASVSELGLQALAQAVAAGELTSEALADELLARCARASALNAFIALEPERVRAAARDADRRRRRGAALGALHGVPLAIKDNIDTADYPTTAGTPALAAHRPRRNAAGLQRLLDPGAIV